MKWVISSVAALALLAATGASAPAQRFDDDARFRAPSIDGTWYFNGDDDAPCEVFQRGDDRATFVNEKGERARGTIRGNEILVPDWYGSPRGEARTARFRGDRILWPDGAIWTRVPYSPYRR